MAIDTAPATIPAAPMRSAVPGEAPAPLAARMRAVFDTSPSFAPKIAAWSATAPRV